MKAFTTYDKTGHILATGYTGDPDAQSGYGVIYQTCDNPADYKVENCKLVKLKRFTDDSSLTGHIFGPNIPKDATGIINNEIELQIDDGSLEVSCEIHRPKINITLTHPNYKTYSYDIIHDKTKETTQ